MNDTSLDQLRLEVEELRASRERVVAAGDAERRRIERDLHDGAQQHLVALAGKLQLARQVVDSDAAAAKALLEEMGHDIRDALEAVRELAFGVYPALLIARGLAEALSAAASEARIPTRVEATGLDRYAGEVEATVYFCCLEALQNAGKHAAGAAVQVRLWEESGGLLFSVRDDGPGFDAAQARGGHGFVNMSDRLGAIGGTVRWESRPGHGATISGSVPVI